MGDKKHYVYSARTTAKGLELLVKTKGDKSWDQFINEAVADHYGLDINVIQLPPSQFLVEREEKRKAKEAEKAKKAADKAKAAADKAKAKAKAEKDKKAKADKAKADKAKADKAKADKKVADKPQKTVEAKPGETVVTEGGDRITASPDNTGPVDIPAD